MSFINSVLADITGGVSTTPLVKHTPPSDNNKSTNVSLKRKAEQNIPIRSDKVARRDLGLGASTPSTLKSPAPKSTNNATPKPTPTTPIAVPTTEPPRKGTYAEILARAKVAQAAAVHVGAIKHKPTEKLSVKDRRALREQEKGKRAKNGIVQRRKAGTEGGVVKADSKGSKHNEAEASKVSKPASKDTGYSGTARLPKPESDYKGTARPASAAPAAAADRSRSAPARSGLAIRAQRSISSHARTPQSRRRYVDEDEEDQDEEEEEDDPDDIVDDASQASSDMEAAPHELEEEEYTSLKTAQKEDLEALKLENELKRKKEERKRALQRLAAKRR